MYYIRYFCVALNSCLVNKRYSYSYMEFNLHIVDGYLSLHFSIAACRNRSAHAIPCDFSILIKFYKMKLVAWNNLHFLI
jgi:hypothetical protein